MRSLWSFYLNNVPVQLFNVQRIYLLRPMAVFHALTREAPGPCARTHARWVTGSPAARSPGPVLCQESTQVGMAWTQSVPVSIIVTVSRQ